jgi:hypothetical protein
MNLILHPAETMPGEDDFHGASRQPVAAFRKYLKDPVQERTLTSTFANGILYARGATKALNNSNHTKWQRIEPGDLALFFRNKLLIGSGEVVLNIKSAELSDDLGRGVEPGSNLPYELIYVVKNIKPWNIDRKDLYVKIGYNNPNQLAFQVIQGGKAADVAEWLEEQSEITRTQLEDIVEKLRDLEETDELRLRLARKEQAYWRQMLFKGSQIGQCAICNEHYPVDLLVAAHIKKRSACDREERLDPNNVLPMCLFGCDALFERGYVFVDKFGRVRLGRSSTFSSTLRNRLTKLDRFVSCWSDKNSWYFAEHAENTGNPTD